MAETKIDEELLEDLYAWVDQIPLSRPKRNIQRDFSDGVLIAETIKHYCPRIIDSHNYAPANKLHNKLTNWALLNRKPFKKLGFEVTEDVMNNICQCKPWAVEQFLMMLRRKIDRHMYENQRQVPQDIHQVALLSDRPEADQNLGIKLTSPISVAGGTKTSPKKEKYGGSSRDLHKLGVQPLGGATEPSAATRLDGPTYLGEQQYFRGEMVPKILVEEKQQEILSKDETVQILQAKVRRLEHLLHLKDIRIDDLQGRLDKLRPTDKLRTNEHRKK